MTVERNFHLAESAINFLPAKEDSSRSFLGFLEGIEGSKEHQVVHMFELQRGPCPAANVDCLIYLMRPDLKLLDALSENLRSAQRTNDKREIHLVFIPHKSIACEKKLKELGLTDLLVSIREFPLYSFMMDVDVMSMEDGRCLFELLALDVRSCLYRIVTCLLWLESLYGVIPNMYAKGLCAETVIDLLRKRREDQQITIPHTLIDSLIVFDRSIDFITPLVTQLTYEGLIDEIFGIKNNVVKLPAAKFSSQDDTPEDPSLVTSGSSTDLKPILLTSADLLYSELRDLNFNAVGPALRRSVKNVSEQLEERHKATTVRHYKEFVKRLPQLQAARQSAANHTTIAEMIKEVTTDDQFLDTVRSEQEILNCIDTDRSLPFIEDAIAKAMPLNKVLRLICLQSLTTDGLKAKVFEQYRKEILQSYGYSKMPLLQNLERAGLIRIQNPKQSATVFSYATLKKSLRLIVDDVNEQEPNDLSYVWSGYAGILVRLCQYWMRPGWRGIQDVMRKLPGTTSIYDEDQQQRYQKKTEASGSLSSIPSDGPRTVLLVFIGGVTAAEISAVRYLASKDESVKFLILSTSLITGDRLLDAFDSS